MKLQNNKNKLIIAGPCSAESKEQLITTAVKINQSTKSNKNKDNLKYKYFDVTKLDKIETQVEKIEERVYELKWDIFYIYYCG